MRIILNFDRLAIVGCVLVVTRYRVEPDDAASFAADAEQALEALVEREGCLRAVLGRAADDVGLWTLTTTWRSVGDYRRALSHATVRVRAVPLMYRAIDEPTAFEELLAWSPGGGRVVTASDRDEGNRR
jgi:quinol monooxygenase YgiN